MLTRNAILRKTLYGMGIYSHILRERYPEDEVVMKVVGRDGGNCRNPYDDGNNSLHVWREKLHPEEKLSDEIARHHDLSGTIPDGDCFEFAERYYDLHDQELLEFLNKELYLHIGEEFNQYAKPEKPDVPSPEGDADAPEAKPSQPLFSFFRKPIRNCNPLKAVTPIDVYNYLTGPYAKEQTEHLRSLTDRKEARAFKANNFDYVTFSGQFSYRDDSKLIQLSNLLCVDLDHLDDVEGTFQALLKDRYFSTVLLFRSPSGDGLKWTIPVQYDGHTHQEVFDAVANYLRIAYGIRMDQNCKDISRACFLPFDPKAYIAPNLK